MNPRKMKRKRWDQFFCFIEGDSPTVLQNELESLGVDVTRVDLAINNITSLSRVRAGEGWLERARRRQADFERGLKLKKNWFSEKYDTTTEILTAIASGTLGSGVQSQAHVFFRKKDLSSTSESDLRSFLDDCEMLGLLEDRKP
jgi:hypothetical protein